ncbi:MAG: RecX family transcriptional regulator [Flavobacteriales bacterium]|nr:RecX family transcriptional regulator [Flavobacteriales bacterium]
MNEPGYEKLLRWCTYRDRCIHETQLKCKELGLDEEQTEKIISRLIQENYLNEKRFATQYALSKSAIKKWGRQKILYELKRKKIDPEIIEIALSEIDETPYQDTLYLLAQKKWNSLKEPLLAKKKLKLRAYLLQKGYSNQEIQTVLKKLINK